MCPHNFYRRTFTPTEPFELIRNVLTEEGFNAVRIYYETILKSSIQTAIQHQIRRARLVIVDLTGNRPNVYHEAGQADAMGKPTLFITQDDHAEFNVGDRQIHRYSPTDISPLRGLIKKTLSEVNSPNELLRAMLVPSSLGIPSQESRFVVAASPLSYRRAVGRRGGYTTLQRTSSDYVGIRGILQSFGLLYGSDVLPDNLDPEDYEDRALTDGTMNLYCIASPKANRWTAKLLGKLEEEWAPSLSFRADSRSRNLRNVPVSIFHDDKPVSPPGWDFESDGDRYKRDFGIIVRSPNPFRNENMATIVAGRSSLGTEAASFALTDPEKIAEIRNELNGKNIDLEKHEQPFWVLVSMKRKRSNGEVDRNSLSIEDVQRFKNR